VPRGTPVTFRFHRTFERTCATEIVLEHEGKKVVKELPLDKPVELTLTFKQPGPVRYACGMDMIRGTITVQ
nr:cupredoxin domain-containing protein [Myxococcota bacterium]